MKVYFLRDERLAISHRMVAAPAVLRGALDALFAGPTDVEAAAGLHTQIPDGTELRSVNLVDGTATIDVTSELERGGGSMSMLARLSEIVFTATQFDNVDEVVFWLDGEPVQFFGGEGIVLDEPWARIDVDRDFTGDILIDSPVPGSTVTSPFVVTGEGDVFEGDFPLEITRDGERLGELINVFAGAYGDWRSFEVSVTVDAPPGPIELVALSGQGCTPDVEPNCKLYETIVPLVLAD
ncbi:MAG: spore gernimation protein [Ilumatobacter sp.]|nr:spore gernimation protein [Ilumatobacter sp.]